MHSLVAFAIGPIGRYVVASGFAIAFLFGVYMKGRADGASSIERQAIRNAASRVHQMEKDNAEFRNLSERDRCRALAQSSGLPVNICD